MTDNGEDPGKGLLLMEKPVVERVSARTMVKEKPQDVPIDWEDILSDVENVLPMTQQGVMTNDYQARLESKISEQTRQICALFLGVMESLVTAIETKDSNTAGHSRRVNQFSLSIARRLGMSSEEIDDLCWGALLHDVGKIAIDPSIQNKPGKLTKEEYEQLMTHVPLGVRIVKPIVDENITNIIRFHHARYDADPLSQALVGVQIPLGARIVTVADSFDAMTSDRPYRKSLTIEAALYEVKKCSRTQFDPLVTDAFLKIPASKILAIVEGPGQSDDEMGEHHGLGLFVPSLFHQRSTALA